jgi:hypothetical protein
MEAVPQKLWMGLSWAAAAATFATLPKVMRLPAAMSRTAILSQQYTRAATVTTSQTPQRAV